MMGANPSPIGTAHAHMQMREVLVYIRANMVVVPEVLVAHADKKFEDEGYFGDETGRFMRQLLENLARVVAASGAGISPVRL